MRTDIEFSADGTILRGWLYRPAGGRRPTPVVVMAHGFAGVKEQRLDYFARKFADSGLAVLVYDHRNFGDSDGSPRQEADPWVQIRDYRNAITFAQTLDGIDPDRVGIWGSSYSGGHVLVVGAIDKRVRCVVSQVPTISGYQSGLRRLTAEAAAELQASFDADRAARTRGAPPALTSIVSEAQQGPAAAAALPTLEFLRETEPGAPNFKREVTLRSIEMQREYEPGIYIARISPTPLLMIMAREDKMTPTDLVLEAYERALQPKKLVLVPGNHYTVYMSQIERAADEACQFLVENLSPR